MFQRNLGKSDITVSLLGLGCWAIGGDAWGKVNDQESIRAIHRALDLGVTFYDTANVYGGGHSERVLGEALGTKRSDVIVATKFGNGQDEQTGQPFSKQSAAQFIVNACEASLRRLNTDYIDLYQFHLNNYDPLDAEPVRNALDSLVQSGKIRYYGWSTDGPEQAQAFADSEHYIAVQQRLNLFEGDETTLAVCEEHNLASINRGPLAMGLLTGKYSNESQLSSDDIRGRNMSWIKSFTNGKPNAMWLSRLEQVRHILASEGRTLTQGALAWLWGRSTQTIPIPGFKTVEQVEENVRAITFGPLREEQMQTIGNLLND
ncbi:MAG: aldo/keto reductase [Chloroflexota bacterium]